MELSFRTNAHHCFFLVRCLGVVALVATLGCDRSDPLALQVQSVSKPDSAGPVSQSLQAKLILDAVIDRYQSLSSYQDDAIVELRYRIGGEATVDRAPMNVAWDRSGRLGLKVYSIEAGPAESHRWHLRVNQSQELAGQVLSRALPDRVTFEWLLTDPIVAHELSVGLAGFPPQLDLLLNPKPLAKLIEEASAISLLPNQTIDGRDCYGVSIEHGHLRYGLWIDEHWHLVRRLELPSQNLPPAILSLPDYADIELSIEFRDIQVNHSIHWDRFRVPLQPEYHRVTQLIAAPSKLDLRGYGKVVPAFQLRDASGQVQYDSRPTAQRKASVLAWLADHPACRAAAEQLYTAEQSLRQAGIAAEEVEFISVWAEPNPPRGLTFEELATTWKLPGRLVVDQAAAGRDLFQIEEAPTVILLDSQARLQLRDVRTNPLLDQALPSLVQRVAAGESLADELVEASDKASRRLNAQLALVRAADGVSSTERSGNAVGDAVEDNGFYDSYETESPQLVEMANQSFASRVKCLIQDSLHTPWVLLADGSLHRLDTSLKSQSVWKTDWIPHGESLRIQPSSDGRRFAFTSDHTDRVEIFDVGTSEPRQFALPGNAKALDIQWLATTTSKASRLAVVTDAKHLLLLDPENREPLSAICPQQPVAIVADPLRKSPGFVVMAGGRLERIQLPGDSSPPGSERLELSFEPLQGPWTITQTVSGAQILAFGLVAKGEPAIHFLDEQFRATWFYRLPIETLASVRPPRVASANSPTDGATIWAILDASGTVHVMRADGQWADHFRFNEPISGLALVPFGDRLILIISHADRITAYKVG